MEDWSRPDRDRRGPRRLPVDRPAKVQGNWHSPFRPQRRGEVADRPEADFQKISGTARLGDKSYNLTEAGCAGDIAFAFVDGNGVKRQFTGRAAGDKMDGSTTTRRREGQLDGRARPGVLIRVTSKAPHPAPPAGSARSVRRLERGRRQPVQLEPAGGDAECVADERRPREQQRGGPPFLHLLDVLQGFRVARKRPMRYEVIRQRVRRVATAMAGPVELRVQLEHAKSATSELIGSTVARGRRRRRATRGSLRADRGRGPRAAGRKARTLLAPAARRKPERVRLWARRAQPLRRPRVARAVP